MLLFERFYLRKHNQNGGGSYTSKARVTDEFIVSAEISENVLANKEKALPILEWLLTETSGIVVMPIFVYGVWNNLVDDEPIECDLCDETFHASFTSLRDLMMFKLIFNDDIASIGVFTQKLNTEGTYFFDEYKVINHPREILKYRPDVLLPSEYANED